MPSKKHTRPADALIPGSACLTCRRRKRKCDAARPACGPCVKINASESCAYNRSYEWLGVKVLTARVSELQENIRVLEEARGPVLRLTDASTTAGSTGRRSFAITSALSSSYASRSMHLDTKPVVLRSTKSSRVDTPVALRDPIAGHLEKKELPSNIRDRLVTIFCDNQAYYFPAHWNMRKFWSAYKLPSSDPEGLHPALIDVLCLLGCLHGPTSLQPYEVIFYKRLNRSLHDSLANKDRLLDFIRASGLAAVYCFARSRVIEGQNRLAAITQFAVACGLHKIDTHDFNAPNLNLFLLGRPRDLTALGDMIHAWWSLFCIDQLGAMVLEIPATLRCDDESVTTIWPCSFEEYEGSGNAAFAPYSGFSSLRSLTPGPDAAIGAYRNVYALRTKSCIMFYRGMRLASAFREGTDVNHDAYVAITVASCLAEDIALYRRQKCPSFDRPSSPAKSDNLVHDSSLIFTISMSYGALIQLFHVFAGDFRSHRKRFDVARKCARFAAKICRVTPSSVNLATWLPWYSAYEVLAWHPIPFEMLGDGAAVAAARTDLDALTDAFKRFGRHYSLDFKNDRAFQRLGALDTQCLSQISQAQ